MKKTIRLLIGTGFCLLLIISWFITVNIKSTAEKQLVLINRATELIGNGIFIRAVPLLEEAAGYNAVHTEAAENVLKTVYLALIDNKGYSRRYVSLLEKQMNRRNADPNTFIEAAEYLFSTSKKQEALAVLRNGINKTGAESIKTMYESTRYSFEINRTVYENISDIFEQTVRVQKDGLWGIATTDGTAIIPCEYDKISTLSKNRAIVTKEGLIYAVDRTNNRTAVLLEDAFDFGNLAENRIAILFEDGWRRTTGDLESGTSLFDEIGMYSNGYAAAKVNGKWGVVDLSDKWLIPAEYDGIVTDELGRCYAQGTVFIQSGEYVYLFTNNSFATEAYEDACPFSDEGYAAVKKNGKWGFIDTNGTKMTEFIYDDALSFGQHLAAVKTGEYWGYINVYGTLVIGAEFIETKSFSGGSAPVLTEKGWQIITLIEYKKGVSL